MFYPILTIDRPACSQGSFKEGRKPQRHADESAAYSERPPRQSAEFRLVAGQETHGQQFPGMEHSGWKLARRLQSIIIDHRFQSMSIDANRYQLID